MSKAPKKRSYHHGNLRRALLDAALELISEVGVTGVTVREAGRRAGVSSGAPYRHFPDKNALLEAIAAEGVALLAADRDARVAAAGEDPIARFRAMGVSLVTFAVAHPSHFKVMTTPELSSDATIAALLREAKDSDQRAIRGILDRSKQEGAVYNADPDVLSLSAQCLVYGLARMLVDGQLPVDSIDASDAEALAVAVTGVFGHGLLPR